MSLINCPECTQRISDHAERCPQCGYTLSLGLQSTQKTGRKSSFPEGTDRVRKSFKLPVDTVRLMSLAMIQASFKTQDVFVNEAVLEYSQKILDDSK